MEGKNEKHQWEQILRSSIWMRVLLSEFHLLYQPSTSLHSVMAVFQIYIRLCDGCCVYQTWFLNSDLVLFVNKILSTYVVTTRIDDKFWCNRDHGFLHLFFQKL